jgi:alpha-beta hydrolase superfamily lysophospholipase
MAEPTFVVNGAGERLALSHHPAPTRAAPTVVVCHGMLSHRQGKVRLIAEALAAAGLGAVRLDHAGCGDSEGSREPFSLERRLADVDAAVAWLAERGGGEVAFAGSSMGAATSLVAAVRHGARAWAGVATPLDHWAEARTAARRFAGRGLVIWGDRDDVVPPEDSNWLVNHWGSRAQAKVFPGGDHRLHEHVPTIASTMARFFTAELLA